MEKIYPCIILSEKDDKNTFLDYFSIKTNPNYFEMTLSILLFSVHFGGRNKEAQGQ